MTQRTVNGVPENGPMRGFSVLLGLVGVLALVGAIAAWGFRVLSSPVVHGPGTFPNPSGKYPQGIPETVMGVDLPLFLLLVALAAWVLYALVSWFYSR